VTTERRSNASIIIAALLAAAALGQCLGGEDRPHRPTDACGGSGSHPVTIGFTMVVGCR